MKMKIKPTNDIAPQAMKIYPTRLLYAPSTVMALTTYGIVPEIITTMPQFIADANDVALSYMISLIYNHVIGPDVNSNTIINITSIESDG